MSTAEKIAVEKSKAAPPAIRNQKPRVNIESLTHRNLLEGEFWRPVFDVPSEQFLDHMWQMKNSLYGEKKLMKVLENVAPGKFIEDAARGFRVAPMVVRVTPYLLSLIDWKDPWNDPIRRQFIPLAEQLEMDHPMLTLDSLHEQKDAPVDGLTHRYTDKALFLPLNTCPVYCRFCTRSYAVGKETDTVEKVNLKINPKRWEEAYTYIASRPELEDIVISGGDTYNLPAKHIRAIGERLLALPNIRRIRFATKGLAVMPMKMLSDDDWFTAISDVEKMGRKKHVHVCIHTHFNHPTEITDISRQAMNKLFEHGITVRNQTVLQRGVNDDANTMALLIKRLGEINVHPYYVYQHDMVQGVEDLRTSLQQACDIEKAVRGVTAGFNTPTFVVDAPQGGGKRDAHSYEHYNRDTGISVYTAPSVKKDTFFYYYDPLHSLSDDMRENWKDPKKRQEMHEDATAQAKAGLE